MIDGYIVHIIQDGQPIDIPFGTYDAAKQYAKAHGIFSIRRVRHGAYGQIVDEVLL